MRPPLVPLVLVHGAGGVGHLWQNQVLAFPRALAPDLPGHPEGPGLSTVPDMAAWLFRYIDGQFLDRPALGGQSLGGAVVLQTALDTPGALRGLVLIATGARLRVRQEFFDLIREDYEHAVAELLRWWFSEDASPRAVERARQALLTVPPAVVHDDFWAADHFDVMERVAAIQLPTLIICGQDDRMTPLKYSEFLHDRIAGSRLVVVPNSGHMVMLEQPRACNEAISEFLGELS